MPCKGNIELLLSDQPAWLTCCARTLSDGNDAPIALRWMISKSHTCTWGYCHRCSLVWPTVGIFQALVTESREDVARGVFSPAVFTETVVSMSITYDLIIIVGPRDNMSGKTEQISKTILSVLMNILLIQNFVYSSYGSVLIDRFYAYFICWSIKNKMILFLTWYDSVLFLAPNFNAAFSRCFPEYKCELIINTIFF